MKCMLSKATACLAMGVCLWSANAATYYVSPSGSDENDGLSAENAFKTPRYAATKATKADDRIQVASGTYLLEEPIWLQNAAMFGESGNPEDVVFDGQKKINCVRISNGNLANVTVQNGYKNAPAATAYGAGIYAAGSSATVSNCVIRENVLVCQFGQAHRGGAGIAFEVSDKGVLDSCRVQDNILTNCSGAGICVLNIPSTGIVITNCVVSNNSAYEDKTITNGALVGGGGISVRNALIVDCNVESNYAEKGEGGGIYASNAGTSVHVLRTRIANNRMGTTGYGGGGISCRKSVTVEDSQILTNSVTGCGGGILFIGQTNIIRNCLIEGNSSTSRGGGTFAYNFAQSKAWYEIDGCIIRDNTSSSGGGGIDFHLNTQIDVDGAVSVRNCLVTGNRSGDTSGLFASRANVSVSSSSFIGNIGNFNTVCGVTLSNNNIAMKNCILWGNLGQNLTSTNNIAAGNYPNVTYTIEDTGRFSTDGTHNIVANPLLDANFAPTLKSPARDAGDIEPWMMLADARDVYGNKRINGGKLDIGAVEGDFPSGMMIIVK